jgi:hypothetical protein
MASIAVLPLSLCLAAASVPYGARAAGDCTPEQRDAALRANQAAVLGVAPDTLASLTDAIGPGGPLAGWQLTHGLVVLAGAGAVAVYGSAARAPMPPVLLYAPSASSSPSEWLDFAGSDGPYRLVGWGYVAPYVPGSTPPERTCVEPHEWYVHEAGWHLRDGDMLLTPGEAAEPRRPSVPAGVLLWHPRLWDLHVWRGDAGVPTIALDNPRAPRGGLELPPGSFLSRDEVRSPRSR